MGNKRGAARARFYTKSNKIFITLITLNCIFVVHYLNKSNMITTQKKTGSLEKVVHGQSVLRLFHASIKEEKLKKSHALTKSKNY